MAIKTDKPWRGVYVASALPFNEDLSVDFDGYAEHIGFLAAGGCTGVAANGSLGEYQTLTEEERGRVVTTAVEAAPEGFGVMAGVGAYGTLETVRWVEQAADAGAETVMMLPPNTYRATEEAVVHHYREAAKVGLPIVAYNNPFDTKVDMSPKLLARLHGEGYIVAVKEFTGDCRRPYEIAEQAPGLDVLVGTDDVLLEGGISGAKGWVSGYPNAFPEACMEVYRLVTSGNFEDIAQALPMYRDLHELFRWDSKFEFVQAIKLSMDMVGRKGGITRPPRTPLGAADEADVRRATEAAIAKGYR